MYKAFRAVRVGDAVGPGKEPGFGLPAGCPFATFFMAVVTQPRRRQLRMVPSKPSVPRWVDDCAAFAQGAAAAIGLGVVQGSGAAEAATAMARWSTACDRWAKVARLSCAMAAKGTFAAAAP